NLRRLPRRRRDALPQRRAAGGADDRGGGFDDAVLEETLALVDGRVTRATRERVLLAADLGVVEGALASAFGGVGGELERGHLGFVDGARDHRRRRHRGLHL